MPNTLDDRLNQLSRVDYDASLDGLESAVWSQVERCRKAASPSAGIQLGLAAAALAMGLIMGLGSVAKAPIYGSELRVLSDDSGLAPSMRLGGV